MIKSPEIDFAVAPVREAAELAHRIQAELVTPALTKGDRSPVTVADFAAQAVIAKRLSEHFPEAVLVGEESSDALRGDDGRESLEQITRFAKTIYPTATTDDVLDWIDRGSGEPPATFWTLDPIDGTKGFLRGDHYAVALAHINHGRVTTGVLACPKMRAANGDSGSVFAATAGQGTWRAPMTGNGTTRWIRQGVSERSVASDARLLRSVEAAHTNTGAIGELVRTLGINAEPVPMDSQAKYAALSSGDGDALVRLLSPKKPNYREKIWDQAAGSIVVHEAGGRVTDLDGKPFDFSLGRTLAHNRGVLATNGRLHDLLLEGLRTVGA
mgnify:CR=1 FL=1